MFLVGVMRYSSALLQEVHEAPKSSSSEQEEPTVKQEDGAESAGVTGGEGGVPLTPEPGTTPEPEDKGDALEALLAAGESWWCLYHACSILCTDPYMDLKAP